MSLRVFFKFVQFRMKERMEYRGAFMLGIIAQILGYGSNYLVVWLLLHKFQTIDGWTWPEIALLYSIGLFTYSLGASFTFIQMTELESMVRQGTFDAILIKPTNPYMYVIAMKFNVGYIAHILISGSILLWSLFQLSIDWSIIKALYFILILISGSMIQAAILSIIGVWSFIVVRTGFLFSLFFRLKDFISYPISVYGTFVQIIIVFLVPLAFVNYFPSTLLLSKTTGITSNWAAWISPLIGPLSLWLAYKIFMKGINKYQGAGG
ncbi:ABC transporter permease [Lederbergia citrea]|uniref:ABC-2 family transporter protein n=1 Tax=Lederbergia citrea TaxID=2833581 RepID=A0A942UL89_9BACI|nr:ABC-2 family transporter protein [Lederbergia citrea]MBS4221797.1 ABC-2 family transporter protein [Lederbergia citrea]